MQITSGLVSTGTEKCHRLYAGTLWVPVDDPKISQVLQVSKCPRKSEKATLRVSGEAETPPQKHRLYIYIYIFILEGHNDGLCIWFCLYMCISQIYILTHTHNIESFHILSIVVKMTTSMHYMHVHLHISATNSYCNHPLPTDRCTHVAPQRLPAHLGKEGFRVFPAAETKVDIKSVRCPVSGETNWWKHPGCVKPKGCQMT